MAWGEREAESPAFRLHFPGDGGERLAGPPPEICEKSARQFEGDSMRSGDREWPSIIRRLDREDPSYKS